MDYKKVIDFTQFQVSNYGQVVRYSWIVAILQQICRLGNISTKDSSTNGLHADQQKTILTVIRIF